MTSRNPFDPRSITDQLRKQLERHPFATLEEAQRFLEAEVRAYNTRPQQELGGLSPLQMTQLLDGDWVTTGPLRINDSIDPAEIGDPDMLFNARVLLTALRDEGPAKATAGGNLSREFVGRMLPRFRWEPGYLEDVRRMNKVIDERDVRPLETVRYMLEVARLIHRRKGFHISPAGRRLLDDARRGELLALLFRTLFRQIDLRSIYGGEDDGLQQTIAFTFWMLRSEAKHWTTPAHLADVAWLDDAKDPPPPWEPPGDTEFRADILLHRVLQPLIGFGVLESRDLPSASKWERPIEVRKTPLFDRLLRFELAPAQA